ncbi:ankyrin repeat protein [Nakamurella sp. UYEF19]|uniref:ankyrin repeat domain-containing protein n=1 Tax=Nakamurella sp. UYEF19 TaxID=1756392 RepID=UPI0033961E93
MGSPDPYGRNALHLAAIAGDLPATEAAIKAGEDVNAHESRSYTALHFAVQEGFVDITAALLAAGADVESRTDIGVTPLRLAAQRWKKSPDGTIITLLKKYGASGAAQDDGGHTVTDVAKNLFRFPPELLELVQA